MGMSSCLQLISSIPIAALSVLFRALATSADESIASYPPRSRFGHCRPPTANPFGSGSTPLRFLPACRRLRDAGGPRSSSHIPATSVPLERSRRSSASLDIGYNIASGKNHAKRSGPLTNLIAVGWERRVIWAVCAEETQREGIVRHGNMASCCSKQPWRGFSRQ